MIANQRNASMPTSWYKLRVVSSAAGRVSRLFALVGIVQALALITWLPRLLDTLSTGDQITENYFLQIVCNAGPITGWPINDESIGTTLGSFAPTLPSFLVARTSCVLAHLLPLSDYQAWLVIGISLTVVITITSSLASGLGLRASLFVGYGLATAPCSFSRIGHLQLSQLWPIMPCIATCAILLARNNYPSRQPSPLYSSSLFGLLMGIISFTAQEYYAVFSGICIVTCYLIGSARAARDRGSPRSCPEISQHDVRNGQKRWHFAKLAGGYLLSMFLFLASKQLLWRIPQSALEATRRLASEQFMYGFWPLNIVTSPLINWKLSPKFLALNLPVTETPFGSSSGILVIAALVITLIVWIKPASNGRQIRGKNEALILGFGGVLLSVISIACIVATPGGLGTIFAAFVSPQLRALNRITPYFYCASLVVCAIKLDQVLALAINKKSKRSHT